MEHELDLGLPSLLGRGFQIHSAALGRGFPQWASRRRLEKGLVEGEICSNVTRLTLDDPSHHQFCSMLVIEGAALKLFRISSGCRVRFVMLGYATPGEAAPDRLVATSTRTLGAFVFI